MSNADPRELTDYENKILANVRDYGCHITTVAGKEPGDGPIFTYSTGFVETVDQPEVIVFGLTNQIHGFMVNEVLRMCRDGLVLEDGVEITGLLEGHRVIARAVHPRFVVRDYLNSAMWYEKRRTGRELDRVVQLVWPGARDGLFPWDEGCDAGVRELQPALYERRLDS